MNTLIHMAEDLKIITKIYDFSFVLGFAAIFIFLTWYGRKMDIAPWKSATIIAIVYPIIFAWMYVYFWIESGFKNFGGNNIVRVFVYVPLAGYLAAKALRLSWKDTCCLLAFAPNLQHGVSHLGCIFAGCCMGYPSTWGLYNIITKDIRFPIQPIEAGMAWIIVVYLFVRGKKHHFKSDGLEYPIMLMLFGSTRFVFEFFRDNEKILLGCSSLAFHALFMFLVGSVAYIKIKSKQQEKKDLIGGGAFDEIPNG